MTLEELGMDPMRVANCINCTTGLFQMIGGWNTLGPAMIVGGVLTALYVKLGPWLKTTVGVNLRYHMKRNFITRLREQRKMRAEREKFLQEIGADIITDALELAFAQGQMTFDEKQDLYRRIGKVGFPDLLPRGELMLKDSIAKRLAEETRDAAGKVVPIKFPDTAGATLVARRKSARVEML